jgi:hypothetical protein
MPYPSLKNEYNKYVILWLGEHSGHCARHQNRRSLGQIPPGCKVAGYTYIAVLLSNLNIHCHCVYFRKINLQKLVIIIFAPAWALLQVFLLSALQDRSASVGHGPDVLQWKPEGARVCQVQCQHVKESCIRTECYKLESFKRVFLLVQSSNI